jgi:23S rRNA pseudouridine955/2504/2580 synthase
LNRKRHCITISHEGFFVKEAAYLTALSLTAAANDDGRRLDRILRKALPDLALSAIHRLLRKGSVLVDGQKAGGNCRVRAGQTITLPPVQRSSPPVEVSLKFTVPDIIFEGAGLLVLNKPAGLIVHDSFAHSGSLESRVRSYLEPKTPPSLSFRSGPLHRLDKPSSGLIVFSANLEGAKSFSALLRERKIKKFYLVLVEGAIGESEIWREELIRDRELKKTFTAGTGNSKIAFTGVKPLAVHDRCTLILAEIETGRTHQIRAQAASHGHPLLGDKKYGGGPGGFFLHAWRMETPEGSPFPRRFEAPLPERFRKRIKELFGNAALHEISSHGDLSLLISGDSLIYN